MDSGSNENLKPVVHANAGVDSPESDPVHPEEDIAPIYSANADAKKQTSKSDESYDSESDIDIREEEVKKTFSKGLLVIFCEFVPEKWRQPVSALITIAVILIGTFCTKEFEDSKLADRAISFFGCLVTIAGLYATSNRAAVDFHPVTSGMLIQYIIALFVLRRFAKNGVAFITSTPFSISSVLVAYLGFGINPQAAVSFCVMSIPTSVACIKLRCPESEEALTAGCVVVPDDEVIEAKNSLHAFLMVLG
ncbi:hypothetical protein NADFUDRAFT_42106 [Nadsonia fulvescens var. elongata DSM 6958]|uniref:Concentrative nucleoside transporter N-terminal domain-containing protein n=1 Tax=Nadsonia fulvescens var. elongata DSM 6958 TaxID=857566 RepID=A0A1E3PLQ9_9ASCO|nr:hypothetical protein NADFUDRAFT_42106 [Nadsonia fulvescens var. elongata DSM 6958]